MTLSIDRLYAFIAADGEGEGIVAWLGPMGWMPMVAADEDRVEALRTEVQKIANAGGKRIVLAKFEVREDLEIFEPNGPPDGGVVIIDADGELQ